MNEDEAWFAPKRYGIGATPVSWQGWATTLGFVAALAALVVAFRGQRLQVIAAVIPLVVTYVVIVARRTRGGLRWRWGEEE
jgi:hypothetical protein